jgi:hypothetical protein
MATLLRPGDTVRVVYAGVAVTPTSDSSGLHLPGGLDLQGVLVEVEVLAEDQPADTSSAR